MEFGTITKVSVGKNDDGVRSVRLLEVDVRDDDPVTVELDASSCDDYVPRIGARVYFQAVTESYLVAVRIQDDNVEPDKDLGSGDRVSFAIDASGNKQATILQESNGNITFDGGTEQAMLGNKFIEIYNALQVPTAFGPSGTPIRPMTVADLSQKVRLK